MRALYLNVKHQTFEIFEGVKTRTDSAQVSEPTRLLVRLSLHRTLSFGVQIVRAQWLAPAFATPRQGTGTKDCAAILAHSFAPGCWRSPGGTLCRLLVHNAASPGAGHRIPRARGLSDNLLLAPAQTFCSKKSRLLDEFVAAVSQYLRLEAASLTALPKDGKSLFEADLDTARKRKEAAKDAIRVHQREHGC